MNPALIPTIGVVIIAIYGLRCLWKIGRDHERYIAGLDKNPEQLLPYDGLVFETTLPREIIPNALLEYAREHGHLPRAMSGKACRLDYSLTFRDGIIHEVHLRVGPPDPNATPSNVGQWSAGNDEGHRNPGSGGLEGAP